FLWTAQQGASNYRILLILPNDNLEEYNTDQVFFEKYLSSMPLGGEYIWLVEAYDVNGILICSSIPFTFSKPKTNPEGSS
ncbi:MAG: hypothetical protein N2D54_02215, partial [Chloroflexota bacterium]